MKPKILLTGKTGQIGSELLHLLRDFGEVAAPSRQEMDLLYPKSIRDVVREARPNLIVNTAAFTAVDAAESEAEKAYAINAEAPGVLAEEAKKAGAALVHYSTDYVFDGRKSTPYEEDDATAPLNVYGKSKLAGEQAIQTSGVPHLIFRTAWVYSTRGRNFLLTILRLATEREEMRIVRDQIGAPTWSREVAASTARILAQMLKEASWTDGFSALGGIYHMTAAGQTSWYDFASAILEAVPQIPSETPWFSIVTRRKPLAVKRIVPISTAEYPTLASRPGYSVLSNSRLVQKFGFALPDWQAQLHQCMKSSAE
ncbi:MAG TPA: dTDP-4-dehydrorhamnose reductase [Methylomirabilota bacterium]|nr:dTDP-4-dehydrorhamnose reductase [Methylomirabilota bacterium]